MIKDVASVIVVDRLQAAQFGRPGWEPSMRTKL
jgi:hypothetical protein